MSRKTVCTLLALICISALAAGCGAQQKEAEIHYCAKCGREATTTLSGPAEIMESSGIPLSACKQGVSGVYSAYVCGSCTGPVADIKPD